MLVVCVSLATWDNKRMVVSVACRSLLQCSNLTSCVSAAAMAHVPTACSLSARDAPSCMNWLVGSTLHISTDGAHAGNCVTEDATTVLRFDNDEWALFKYASGNWLCLARTAGHGSVWLGDKEQLWVCQQTGTPVHGLIFCKGEAVASASSWQSKQRTR